MLNADKSIYREKHVIGNNHSAAKSVENYKPVTCLQNFLPIFS